MAEHETERSLLDRLEDKTYSRSACIAAIRGESVPDALGLELHRLCTVRGIRYHHGFAEELHGVLPIFTRALNARSIMSNVIPDMKVSDPIEMSNEIPYCIWHPDTASEDTYRELVRRYPQMVYQIGRACAVAGYTQLYSELDILPDVHIAEEARECGRMAIYEAIVSQKIRYSIMNDYTRSIAVNDEPAFLNGDTAARWMLDVKQKFQDYTYDNDDWDFIMCWSVGYEDTTFNITEDMNIDEVEVEADDKRILATRSDLQLLYEPLPADLPTVDKDLLILMAACHGNVDRYVRLRRPKPVHYAELRCCVRGIYHSTFFAVWWSKQTGWRPGPEPGPIPDRIEKAINARFIMNNVLSRAPFKQSEIPYLIWWPMAARPSTYRHLAKLQPEMLPQIVRACIYAGYKDVFDELLVDVTPDEFLVKEASEQRNPHFSRELEARVKALNIALPAPGSSPEYWKRYISSSFDRSSMSVNRYVDLGHVGTGFDWPYDGWQCDAGEVEFMACVPDEWKLAEGDEKCWRELDYQEWPPSGPALWDASEVRSKL